MTVARGPIATPLGGTVRKPPLLLLALTAGVYEHDVPTALAREKECRALSPSSDMRGLMVEFVDPLTKAPPSSDATSDSTPTPSLRASAPSTTG